MTPLLVGFVPQPDTQYDIQPGRVAVQPDQLFAIHSRNSRCLRDLADSLYAAANLLDEER